MTPLTYIFSNQRQSMAINGEKSNQCIDHHWQPLVAVFVAGEKRAINAGKIGEKGTKRTRPKAPGMAPSRTSRGALKAASHNVWYVN